MKRKRIFIVLVSVVSLVFLRCSREDMSDNYNQKDFSIIESYPISVNDIRKLELDEDELGFEVESNSVELIYHSLYNNGQISTKLRFESPGLKPVRIDYVFDLNEKHWKLVQAEKVIHEAGDLTRTGYPVSTLSQVVDLLTFVFKKLPATQVGSTSSLLISSISYHKSIINTTIRSIMEGTDCDCTVHPFFLTDKTYFNCQEEHFYDAARLAESLEKYLRKNNTDKFALKLKQYLLNNRKERIRFDEYYGLYVDKATFKNAMESQKNNQSKKIVVDGAAKSLQANVFSISTLFKLFQNDGLPIDVVAAAEPDCGDNCLLGCGSDHGCCGNYEGCCYYVHGICTIHDDLCTNCEPRWFCFDGCVPD
ncbi:hypothetical protein [Parapedobacter sp.]